MRSAFTFAAIAAAAYFGYRWWINRPNATAPDSQPSVFTLGGIPQTRAGVARP